MRRRITRKPCGYGLCCVHDDGSVGWFIDKNADPLCFDSEEEAQRELSRLKRDKHYSWNGVFDVRLFDGQFK